MALLNRHARIALGVAGTTALLATKDGATAADLSDRTPPPATGMHLGAVQLQSAGVPVRVDLRGVGGIDGEIDAFAVPMGAARVGQALPHAGCDLQFGSIHGG